MMKLIEECDINYLKNFTQNDAQAAKIFDEMECLIDLIEEENEKLNSSDNLNSDDLKSEIDDLKFENEELKIEIDDLKTEIEKLKTENLLLKKRKKAGRPCFPEDKKKKVFELLAKDISYRNIAKIINCSPTTVTKIAKERSEPA